MIWISNMAGNKDSPILTHGDVFETRQINAPWESEFTFPYGGVVLTTVPATFYYIDDITYIVTSIFIQNDEVKVKGNSLTQILFRRICTQEYPERVCTISEWIQTLLTNEFSGTRNININQIVTNNTQIVMSASVGTNCGTSIYEALTQTNCTIEIIPNNGVYELYVRPLVDRTITTTNNGYKYYDNRNYNINIIDDISDKCNVLYIDGTEVVNIGTSGINRIEGSGIELHRMILDSEAPFIDEDADVNQLVLFRLNGLLRKIRITKRISNITLNERLSQYEYDVWE